MEIRNRKKFIWGTAVAIILAAAAIIWSWWLSPTRIAFINYQAVTLGEISRANNNSMIRVAELKTEDMDRIKNFDMVFINAMGLRITQEQRELIQEAADGGLPVLTTAATNPENDITSLDADTEAELGSYITNGGRKNYRSLLNYVRKYIDGKLIGISDPDSPVMRDNSLLHHSDPKNPDDEDLGFNSVAQYDSFLGKAGLLKPTSPRIIVTGQMGDPTELVAKLEEKGNVVYLVRDMRRFVKECHIDSVNPSAVINMAHGRLGDYMVDYLKEQNIPLFTTLNVNRRLEEWESDKMGMSGGFLSQSIVTPEIDGAIRPYVLFGHRLNADGIEEVYAIPERLETFVNTVNRYIQLKKKSNSAKKVAIYYYKGPGQGALTAAGMEVAPSLFNLLLRMKQAGYRVDGLPQSAKELESMIQTQGSVFATYHEGVLDDFIKNGSPASVSREEYESWVKSIIHPDTYQEVVERYGEFPGKYMNIDSQHLAVARLQFGNVVLLPQNMAGEGDNTFAIVHGTDAAPPHPYIASYLWTQFGFKADVLVHFGTHGSLEFTPRKQVALSSRDWPDRLVGSLPHLYIYSIDDVGEGMIAKRRSYATLQSHLTPPFLQSEVRGVYNQLSEAIKIYNNQLDDQHSKSLEEASLKVKKLTVSLGVHRDLGLDSVLTKPYTSDEISRLESFVEELAGAKITGQLYTMGIPYEEDRIISTVYAMATEPIAYSLLALDRLRKQMELDVDRHKSLFTQKYLKPAREIVTRLLQNPGLGTDNYICQITGVTAQELEEARAIEQASRMPQDMMQMMQQMAEKMVTSDTAQVKTEGKGHPHGNAHAGSGMKNPNMALKMAKAMGASAEQLKKMKAAMAGKNNEEKESGMGSMMKKMASMSKQYTKEQKQKAQAIMEVERSILNVGHYRDRLIASPDGELTSFLNALDGGYTAPSSGGDPITNPTVLPTGRNLFAINAENTPSESAWEKGKKLAVNTIEMYRKRHNDSIPRKVSYTLWSGEFIETEGATIAQVLYMLGVEPLWDPFGRVTDLRLIPSRELGRPRIDVVVQTSGQLRDIAASRLFLINRAVEMAANARDDAYENLVSAGVVEAERVLVEKGVSPKEARNISYYRIFGGMNGNYGTGIQGMVQASDRWNDEKQIAEVYLNNMGAFYGDEKNWEKVQQFAFEAALSRTDAVVQPRQSNTWGALSLDHVYEFMGGMNLVVRNVTGKDPDAYLSDYRNHNNMRMQEVKEAVGVESRTTIFNPVYIKEKMKGGASSANTFTEIIQNTFGWNVMKPSAIDNEMWDEIYDVYVNDKFNLGIKAFFEDKNPAALQDITATMLESARKGMWKAQDHQLKQLADLHTELVKKYKLSGSYASTENERLQQFIASKVDAATADAYKKQIADAQKADISSDKGLVMKKERMNQNPDSHKQTINNLVVGTCIVVVLMLLLLWVRRRRRQVRQETEERENC